MMQSLATYMGIERTQIFGAYQLLVETLYTDVERRIFSIMRLLCLRTLNYFTAVAVYTLVVVFICLILLYICTVSYVTGQGL